MNRRGFLGLAALAAGEITAAAFEISWLNSLASPNVETSIPGLIQSLPAATKDFAWTIDDAGNADALGVFIDRIIANSLNVTFFVNSSKQSWSSQASKLLPLVESGQAQLGNHSHYHLDLTTLSNKQVHEELSRCHSFMLDTYGYDARPYWRPPYRQINKRVAAIAADIGYTTPTLWNKNLQNAAAGTKTSDVLRLFETQATAGAIMLDHLHGLEADQDFATAMNHLKQTNLKSVTLNQVFGE